MVKFDMDLREVGCEGGRWMELAQNHFQCVRGVEPLGFDARTLVPY
jgi:hypothetical protein